MCLLSVCNSLSRTFTCGAASAYNTLTERKLLLLAIKPPVWCYLSEFYVTSTLLRFFYGLLAPRKKDRQNKVRRRLRQHRWQKLYNGSRQRKNRCERRMHKGAVYLEQALTHARTHVGALLCIREDRGGSLYNLEATPLRSNLLAYTDRFVPK